MTRIPTLVGILLFPCLIVAQKPTEYPTFGKVDKEELLLKDCPFDKNAEAVVLYELGETYCNAVVRDQINVHLEFERRVRIKILNDRGLSSADIKIPYYNQTRISDIEANTYNLDGGGNIVVTKLDKKNIYNKRITKKSSEYTFSLPEVKAGSVIEYKYRWTFNTENIFLNPEDWIFQRSIPVMNSRYIVNFPEDLEVNCQVQSSLPYSQDRRNKAGREIQTYSMMAIPALRDEPYISCQEDYLQKVNARIIAFNYNGRRFPFSSNWVKIIKSLMEDEDFGVQLKRNVPMTEELDLKLKTIKDPYNKMIAVHNYVRKNMEWNGAGGIWALDGVRSAWKEKKGNSGEINLILVNLLKEAGLNAHPILVSTKENGRVNTGIPEINQFNKVLAHVVITENENEKVFVLDGTDEYTPPRLFPLDVMYSEGLVIEKLDSGDWGWSAIWDENQKFRDVINNRAVINADGSVQGSSVINSFDYSRIRKMPYTKNGGEKMIPQFFSKNAEYQVDSLELQNDAVDTLPLVQKFKFKGQLNSSGEYIYFNGNMFSGLETNPFIADARFSDVFFSANQHYSLTSNFTIPEGYQFDALPKNLRMVTPDTSIRFTRQVFNSEKEAVMRISLEIRKPVFSTEEYPDFQEFYKQLFNLLNEQFIIRKKSANP